MKNLKDEIMGKNEQIALLEKQITDSIVASHKKIDSFELSNVSLVSLLVVAFYFLPSPNLCCMLFHAAVCFRIDGTTEREVI